MHYRTIQEVMDDVKLVWENCRMYNGEHHPLSVKTFELEKIFDEKVSKFSPAGMTTYPRGAFCKIRNHVGSSIVHFGLFDSALEEIAVIVRVQWQVMASRAHHTGKLLCVF